ncbi:hypothetical protein [Vibrio sp. PID17_43]|uniref:hypothetical protein n=2 Tax=Vibrionaceae TaxID=641 RepID=UPI000BFFFDA4|nr:hypothetical protein [Vibrio sp. PID17_43]PHJ43248.1 hypothetical protein AK965_01805 [Vibrio sp. PID17_43]
MRLEVGGDTTASSLKRLSKNDVKMNLFAQQLLEDGAVHVSRQAEIIKVTIKTPFEFGLYFGAILDELIQKMKQCGLSVCPIEFTLYLRLQDLALCLGEYLAVDSSPISEDESYPRGIYIRNLEDGLWLRGFRSSVDFTFPPSMNFVFINS